MKVYCQIDEGICRYLEENNLRIELLWNLGMMEFDSELGYFWKSSYRPLRSILIDCSDLDFEKIFTESFQLEQYVGEIMEDYMTQAFFRYICQ